MSLPTDRTAELTSPPHKVDPSKTGRSSGINTRPGSDDDGWVVPPPVPLGDGSDIQLYKDGEAWHVAFEAMRSARRSICLEVYIFASDDTGRAAADLLCIKAREGVRVFVMYDSFGSIDSHRTMFDDMRRAGVRLQQFHPVRPWECKYSWRPVNRDHRKLLVIDNHFGGLGGLNLGTPYAGSWVIKSKLAGTKKLADTDFWRDTAIGVRGPSAVLLQRAFNASWRYTKQGGPIHRAQYLHDIHHGEFGILASVPTMNSPLQPFLLELLSGATQSIQLTMAYFAPADTLVDELCAAARRGVRVQLMLPGRGDVKLLVIAARSFYSRLMECGVEVYERQDVVLHAKTMVIDGHTAVVGSTNLDYRSIEYNCELSAIIRSARFAKQMHDLFENDIGYSKRIDPHQWQERPMWDRIGQWAVSRARYLL